MGDILFYAALPWILSWAIVGVVGITWLVSRHLRSLWKRHLFDSLPETVIDDDDEQSELECKLQAEKQPRTPDPDTAPAPREGDPG